MRALVKLLIGAIMFGLALAEAGASDRPPKTVLVAVDLSSSTLPHRNDYLKYFRMILDTMGEGDKLLVLKISERPSASESLAFPAAEYEIGSLVKNSNKVRDGNLKRSLGVLKNFELLLATQVDETPIVEVTLACPRLFSLYKSERMVLVYLSDMMEFSRTTANFESVKPPFNRKAAEEAIGKIKREGRVANLSQVTVYVAGARELDSDKGNPVIAMARKDAAKWFWSSYFAMGGAKLDPSSYAADLLKFDELECNSPKGACSNGVFVREWDKRKGK